MSKLLSLDRSSLRQADTYSMLRERITNSKPSAILRAKRNADKYLRSSPRVSPNNNLSSHLRLHGSKGSQITLSKKKALPVGVTGPRQPFTEVPPLDIGEMD